MNHQLDGEKTKVKIKRDLSQVEGMYRDLNIDVAKESQALRREWDRKID